jgi:hypothetical protein
MDGISAAASVIGVSSAIGSILRVIYRFSTIADEVMANRNECNRLISHIRETMNLITARNGQRLLSVRELSRLVTLERLGARSNLRI